MFSMVVKGANYTTRFVSIMIVCAAFISLAVYAGCGV